MSVVLRLSKQTAHFFFCTVQLRRGARTRNLQCSAKPSSHCLTNSISFLCSITQRAAGLLPGRGDSSSGALSQLNFHSDQLQIPGCSPEINWGLLGAGGTARGVCSVCSPPGAALACYSHPPTYSSHPPSELTAAFLVLTARSALPAVQRLQLGGPNLRI